MTASAAVAPFSGLRRARGAGSPQFRGTANGPSKTPPLALRRCFRWSAIIKRLLTLAPVGKRLEWAAPGHAAPGAASI